MLRAIFFPIWLTQYFATSTFVELRQSKSKPNAVMELGEY